MPYQGSKSMQYLQKTHLILKPWHVLKKQMLTSHQISCCSNILHGILTLQDHPAQQWSGWGLRQPRRSLRPRAYRPGCTSTHVPRTYLCSFNGRSFLPLAQRRSHYRHVCWNCCEILCLTLGCCLLISRSRNDRPRFSIRFPLFSNTDKTFGHNAN